MTIGEMETSIILHFRPELVVLNEDGSLRADAGAVRPFRYEALEKGWVTVTRPWHLLTTNSGAGNPHSATAEKGQRLTDSVSSLALRRFCASWPPIRLRLFSNHNRTLKSWPACPPSGDGGYVLFWRRWLP